MEISDGTDSSVQLFDQYNDFEFRRTEFLVIDDGATADEIFELHTSVDANIKSWDNEIRVASDRKKRVESVGGEDHVFLGSGQDTVKVDVMDALYGHDGNFSGRSTISASMTSWTLAKTCGSLSTIESTRIGGST